MKYTWLALLLLVPQPGINANIFKLNKAQAQVVAQLAFIAGVMGAGQGFKIAAEEDHKEFGYRYDLTVWQRIKALKWRYVIAVSALCAVGIGSFAYSSCLIDNAIDSYYGNNYEKNIINISTFNT